jgi:hypothetical protein
MVLEMVSIFQRSNEGPVLTIVLCDLIPRRLILVEVMFPIKPTDWLYLTVQCNGSAESWKECCDLEFLSQISPGPISQHCKYNTNRLATRECQIEQGNVGIRSFTCRSWCPYSIYERMTRSLRE